MNEVKRTEGIRKWERIRCLRHRQREGDKEREYARPRPSLSRQDNMEQHSSTTVPKKRKLDKNVKIEKIYYQSEKE